MMTLREASERIAEEMPLLGLLVRAAAAILLLLLMGCASPHRAAYTRHEVRRYQGRADGLVSVEVLEDREHGGGCFLFADPQVTALTVFHTNQTGLGGGSLIQMGPSTVVVDPHTGEIIGATGTAVGNVVGAAVHSSAGIP